MKVKKSKSNKRIVYLVLGLLGIVAITILFLSSEKGDIESSTPPTMRSETETTQFRATQSGNLKIENAEGDKLKIFNGEDEAIKSSDISFFINGAAIRCSGIKDLEPKKSVECTMETRCNKVDILKITYSGKSIEYNC